MPKITNRVLTSPHQGLSEVQMRHARENIDAMQKAPIPEGDDMYVMIAEEGVDKWVKSELVDDPVADLP